MSKTDETTAKAQAAIEAVTAPLTATDFQNLVVFLDRVETKGLAEAQLLTLLAAKCQKQKELLGGENPAAAD